LLFSENTLFSVFSGEPPDQTFSKLKKKFGGGNLKKYAKAWAGGATQFAP
jgi:hypothetical protein